MQGNDETSGSLSSYVDLEARTPARHSLRKIRQVVNAALASLDATFAALYTDFVPPGRAGEADPGKPAADPLFDPLGAASHGADGL